MTWQNFKKINFFMFSFPNPLGLFAKKQQKSLKKANEHETWWTKSNF